MPTLAPQRSLTPAAERMRRLRARRRDGLRVVAVEVDAAVVTALVERGWIGPGQVADPQALSDSLADLIECWADGRLSEHAIGGDSVTRNAPDRPALAFEESPALCSEHGCDTKLAGGTEK